DADERVAEVAGTGFVVTPVVEIDLSDTDIAGTGPVVAKVETANVSGSHKARHLFGLLLDLLIEERAGDAAGGGQGSAGASPPLAIASCGNAALGAAVVARSARRRLLVYVPTDADPAVLAALDELGAEVQVCRREAGTDGDPCVHALHAALADGARAFTVQGPVCPNVIDGGRTLGLELAEQLDELGIAAESIFIQIGGGALATAVMDGLARRRPGRALPRLHPVQARRAHPYVTCWRRVAPALRHELGLADGDDDRSLAEAMAAALDRIDVAERLAAHGDAMVPWPATPSSVASGILDDVTYDWRTVMAHQIETGGWPILVDEETFVEAAALAAAQVEPPPDETGAAGLAGLLELRRSSPDAGDGGPAVVLLTGVAR
ncbi:MAG: PLP-dependent lyase/thiolase, partial [Acidimicrobiia bacterium]|nr:PLP-dependent lyase/thiolase [Acidimicrobiia bacterium]